MFSWLAEPSRWENVDFLVAQDEQLREEALGLPLVDESGRPLRYVSPHEVESNAEFGRHLAELDKRARAAGQGFRPAGLDKKIEQLADACNKFRLLTFNPKSPEETPQRFYTRLRASADAWRKLADELQRVGLDDKSRLLKGQIDAALKQILPQIHGGEFVLEKVEPPVTAFCRACDQMAARLANGGDKRLADLAAELRRQAAEMHMALYDNGVALLLVPELSLEALEEDRSPGDDAKPWLSFQALMYGSDELLRDYPQPELQAVRKAWAEVKAAYTNREAADRPAKFALAMNRFAEAIRALGQQIEPLRAKLPIRQRDEDLLRATAYPLPGSTDAEVFYNRVDPFFWSWVASLAATLCLLLAVGRLRKPLFLPGMAVLALAQVLTVIGLGLRGYVTGLVPLTGMFETVVFVALGVALLGLWFALLPLFGPGLKSAWQLSAAKHDAALSSLGGLSHWFLLVLRLGLMVVLFRALARWRVFDLLPPRAMEATMPSANDILVWLAGLGVFAAVVYYLPRAAVTLLAGLFTVPLAILRGGIAGQMELAFQRRLFVLAGAIVSFVAMVLAYYAPSSVMHRNIGSVTPILRDNYWLAVHVVTIMTSYASAAIALILGNIALGYYLFGRYVWQPLAASPAAGKANANRAVRSGRRPPPTCAVLAGFTYTAIQITVALLTAGTILGACGPTNRGAASGAGIPKRPGPWSPCWCTWSFSTPDASAGRATSA